MNAKITCMAISGLLYLTDDEMSELQSQALSSHLESCPSCKKKHSKIITYGSNLLYLSRNVYSCPS